MLRKRIFILQFLIFVSMAFSFAKPINEVRPIKRGAAVGKSEKKQFKDLEMVELRPDNDDELFDVYTIGENSQAYTARRLVAPFKMNAYETTYYMWYAARIYGEQNGYVFGNPGQEGSNGKRGAPPTPPAKNTNSFQPVTTISWYDAVVWCNALSELFEKTPCYTYKGKVLRNSTDKAALDQCECNWYADGYRLPTEAEWEYAARKTKTGFQSGALASGQYEDGIAESDVAWSDANATGTHVVGTAGAVFEKGEQPQPASGNANAAGIFDMSGNVMELCWDWFSAVYEAPEGIERSAGPEMGNERVARGGSWSPYTGFIYAGDRYSYDPNEAYNYLGFRVCTSCRECAAEPQ